MREYRGGRDRKERLKVVSLVQMRRAKNGSSRGTGAVTFLKSASTLGGLEGSPSFCAALFTAVNAQDISIQDEKSDDCAVINWTNQTPDYNSSFYAARF
jgi:hypothetical protein